MPIAERRLQHGLADRAAMRLCARLGLDEQAFSAFFAGDVPEDGLIGGGVGRFIKRHGVCHGNGAWGEDMVNVGTPARP